MTREDRENSSTSLSRSAWLAHLKASCQSGLSRAEYCRRHNISYHALTYWYKKTAQQHISVQPGSVNLVPVSLPAVQRPPATRESSRITSYNVCYTKLLRSNYRSGRYAADRDHWQRVSGNCSVADSGLHHRL